MWNKKFLYVKVIICVMMGIGVFILGKQLIEDVNRLVVMWETQRNIIIALGILFFFWFPSIYSFVVDFREKDKKIAKILQCNNYKEMEKKLNEINFCTLCGFLANVSRQFSSLLIVIFIQVLFWDMNISTVVDENGRLTAQIYINIIIISLVVFCIVFILSSTGSKSLLFFGGWKDRHIKKIIKLYKR